MKTRKKINFGADYALNLQAINKRKVCVYGIQIDIQENSETSIHANFLMRVERIRSQEFIFTRQMPIIVNEKQPETLLEELAVKCSQVLYPLHVGVHRNGRMKEVKNYQDILRRWRTEKPSLEKYYKGKVAEKYRALFDKRIQNIDTFQTHLLSDYFFSIFFLPIYQKYTARLLYEEMFYIPSFPGVAPLKHIAIFRPQEFFTENEFIQIDFEGNFNDKRNWEDIENKSALATAEHFIDEEKITPIVGDINGKILLHKDRTIKNMVITNKLAYKGKKRTIDIGIYQQAEELQPTSQPLSKRRMQFFIDEKPTKR